MRVIISPNDAAPVEFSHPALFVPNAEAVAAAPARAEPLAREAAEAAKTADEAKKAAATAAHEAASLTASLRKLEWLKPRADAELAFVDKALAAAKTDQAEARAEELAVLNNQPQGGFLMRRPTVDVPVARNQPQGGLVMRRPTVNVPVASGNDWGNDGFGFFFQRNWNSQPANTRPRAGQYYQPMQQRWW